MLRVTMLRSVPEYCSYSACWRARLAFCASTSTAGGVGGAVTAAATVAATAAFSGAGAAAGFFGSGAAAVAAAVVGASVLGLATAAAVAAAVAVVAAAAVCVSVSLRPHAATCLRRASAGLIVSKRASRSAPALSRGRFKMSRLNSVDGGLAPIQVFTSMLNRLALAVLTTVTPL